MSNFKLSRDGATKLYEYLESHPPVRSNLSDSFYLDIAQVNAALGTQFTSGQEAHGAIGGEISPGFSDYPSPHVKIDETALHLAAKGIQPRSR